MGCQDQSIGIVDQCISGNTGLWLIGFRQTTVNDEQFAVTFDRRFSRLCLDRDVSVNNVGICARQTKFL